MMNRKQRRALTKQQRSRVVEVQRDLARRHGARPDPPFPDDAVLIAADLRSPPRILHAARLARQPGFAGWLFWTGFEDDPGDVDTFEPIHAAHLTDWCLPVVPLLGLPRGWRLTADLATFSAELWFDRELR